MKWQKEYEEELADAYECGVTHLQCINCSPNGCEHRRLVKKASDRLSYYNELLNAVLKNVQCPDCHMSSWGFVEYDYRGHVSTKMVCTHCLSEYTITERLTLKLVRVVSRLAKAVKDKDFLFIDVYCNGCKYLFDNFLEKARCKNED